MSNKAFRQIVRWIHLMVAGVIGVYIFLPWSSDPTFTFIVRFVVIPLLALTGVGMWQQPRLLKLLKHKPAE